MPLIPVLVLVVSTSLFVSTPTLADVTELLGQEDESPIVSNFARQMGCGRKEFKYFKCMNTG